jgi:hypothetical protein
MSSGRSSPRSSARDCPPPPRQSRSAARKARAGAAPVALARRLMTSADLRVGESRELAVVICPGGGPIRSQRGLRGSISASGFRGLLCIEPSAVASCTGPAWPHEAPGRARRCPLPDLHEVDPRDGGIPLGAAAGVESACSEDQPKGVTPSICSGWRPQTAPGWIAPACARRDRAVAQSVARRRTPSGWRLDSVPRNLSVRPLRSAVDRLFDRATLGCSALGSNPRSPTEARIRCPFHVVRLRRGRRRARSSIGRRCQADEA